MRRRKKRSLPDVLADRLKARRDREGLTRKTLAERAQVAVTVVYYLEQRPGGTNPSLETLERLASALGVPVTELLDQEASPPKRGELSKPFFRLINRLRDRPPRYLVAIERLVDAFDRGIDAAG